MVEKLMIERTPMLLTDPHNQTVDTCLSALASDSAGLSAKWPRGDWQLTARTVCPKCVHMGR